MVEWSDLQPPDWRVWGWILEILKRVGLIVGCDDKPRWRLGALLSTLGISRMWYEDKGRKK